MHHALGKQHLGQADSPICCPRLVLSRAAI
jgi:hypothetical protein